MRMLLLAAFILPASIGVVLAEPGSYSVRDAGFVEVPTPYRLVVLASDPTAADLKKQQASLLEEMHNSNVVFVHYPNDPKKAAEFPAIKFPTKVTGPVFWLVAPDDRAVPFDPTMSMSSLMQSPLRQAIQNAVAESLCTVILLESTDADANKTARAKVDAALTTINRNRQNLPKAPDADVRLLTLTASQREQERWTLWALGEEAAPAQAPKVAILFGKMRRAGALFEGTDWEETDLIRRIAALALPCDNRLCRQQLTDASLPFRWATDWAGKVEASSQFNPVSDAVRVEVKELLAKPPLPDSEQKAREKMLEDMIVAFKELNELPPLDPNDPLAPVLQDAPGLGPSMLASSPVALGLLAVGIAGWIGLAISAYLLERRVRVEST